MTAQTRLTPSQKRKLVNDIIGFLYKHELTGDVIIYADKHAYRFDEYPGYILFKHSAGKVWISEEEVDVETRVEYANPDTITMTFEGDLYHIINDYPDSKTACEFEKIFKRYGLYYEQGYAWSLAAYF